MPEKFSDYFVLIPYTGDINSARYTPCIAVILFKTLVDNNLIFPEGLARNWIRMEDTLETVPCPFNQSPDKFDIPNDYTFAANTTVNQLGHCFCLDYMYNNKPNLTNQLKKDARKEICEAADCETENFGTPLCIPTNKNDFSPEKIILKMTVAGVKFKVKISYVHIRSPISTDPNAPVKPWD